MMRKGWLVLTGFLLFGGLVFGQVPTQQQRPRVDNFGIRGKIIVGTGREGDMRIEVRLEKTLLQTINTTYTDGAGNFEFRNLQAGMYNVVVELEGYEPVRQSVELYNQMGVAPVTIFLNKPAEVARKAGGLDGADPDVIDVSQMRERFPKKAIQDYEKALEEKKKGQTDKAIKLLEEAIHIAPTFYHAHNNLGILYHMLKRYADAEKEYRRARELNVKNVQPLINLGSLYIEESDSRKSEGEDVVGKLLDQALDILEQAVKLDSHSAMAYYYLGSANYKSSFLEEAEAALKKALELDSRLTMSRLMLVNVYMKQNRWRSVLEHLDVYLQENPKANDRAAIEEMRARVAKGLEAANK
jgi:tetratricopeptide (TPR) repeat protein